MTLYEFARWATFPLMTTHLRTVRRDLKNLVNSNSRKGKVLDVGGRTSPYTINLNCDVTLLDIPQESTTQESLNLGLNDGILKQIKKRRSNIKDIVIEDMTKSTLQSNSYDAVISIEVIEHVLEDDIFVKNVASVIKKGGWAYFTTPNGDFIKNEGPDKNPDHVRHYKKKEFEDLLNRYFNNVNVHYAVKTGKYRVNGLRGFRIARPFQAITSIISNWINWYQSKDLENEPENTAHLVAIVFK